MKKLIATWATVVLMTGLTAAAHAAESLKRIAKYDMPATVKGRFDHLGVDLRGNRLFLTAESAHEVLVFNLRNGKFIRAITDIGIPHAVFCREDLDRIYITDGGAGKLKIYDGKTSRLLGAAKLKVAADLIAYDPATHDLYIDNGGGDAHELFSMLSVVDTISGKKVTDIQIDGETLEAMALAHSSPGLYVNNPAKNEVDVVNRETRFLIASWPVTMGKRNVAMALDEPSHRLFVACRSGEMVVFDTWVNNQIMSENS
jgi:DNA-binding beta-propeller fold protein YncE